MLLVALLMVGHIVYAHISLQMQSESEESI